MSTTKNMNILSRDRFNKEVVDWSNINKNKDIISWERYVRLQLAKQYLLKNYAGKKISILEVGCGAGQNIKTISALDSRWYCSGVDISENMIAYCNKHHKTKNTDFSVLNIEEKALQKKYDVILLLGVVGYLNNNYVAFKHISKMLKPGGSVFFTYGKKSFFRWLRYVGVRVLHTQLIRSIYNSIKTKLLGQQAYDPVSSVFSAYSFRHITGTLSKHELNIKKTYDICFGAGYLQGLSVIQSKCIEWLTNRHDYLNMAMTRIVVARQKK